MTKKSANIVKANANIQHDILLKLSAGHRTCSLYSAGTESGPSSLRTAITSEVGVSGGSWERSSEHLLTVGEITSGLVSQDSVLCSELAVVVVVATLGGTGSNSSSSSSRTGDSWTSARKNRHYSQASVGKLFIK